ncbi:hypothetical protein INT47_012053 [Mucor saturninus]|uniref:Uncharacterized protein n=1 Tax=Mucor saturninus TaxID=64648 RepID=A0A8H7QHU4_9FUNG|nr:hypothetical protein INT47_012053 [Mucor saturninus]
MQSIVSTFVGMVFPHTLEVDNDNNKVYFLLYESFSARYSGGRRKIPHEASLNVRNPMCTTYIQQIKYMVHPEVGPTQLSEGVKEGYFHVNLSANQDFEIGPDFFESTFGVNDDLESLNNNIRDPDQPTVRPDNEEIENPQENNSTSNVHSDVDEDDSSDDDLEGDQAAREYFRSGRRFSDSSSDDDFEMEQSKKDATPVFLDSDGEIVDEEMDRMQDYVDEVEQELLNRPDTMQQKGDSENRRNEERVAETEKNISDSTSLGENEKATECGTSSNLKSNTITAVEEEHSTKDNFQPSIRKRRIIKPETDVNEDSSNTLDTQITPPPNTNSKGKMPDRQNVEPFRLNINHLLTLSSANIASQTSARKDNLQAPFHPFFRKRNVSMSSSTSDISDNSASTQASSDTATSIDNCNSPTSKKRMNVAIDSGNHPHTMGKKAKLDLPSRSSNESDTDTHQQEKRKPGRPKKKGEPSKKGIVVQLPDIIKKARGRPKKDSDKEPPKSK